MKTFHLGRAILIAAGAALALAQTVTGAEPLPVGQSSFPANSALQQQWRPPTQPPRFGRPPRIPVVPPRLPDWGRPPTPPTQPTQPYIPPSFTPPQPYIPHIPPPIQTPQPSASPKRQPPRYSPIPDILPPQASSSPPVKQIWICSNCKRRLPDNVRPGDRCPYCGTYLAYQRDASGRITHTVPIGKYLLIGGLIPVGVVVIGVVIWFLKNI
jgi:hypothetical protein